MITVTSKNFISIRLTEERWAHIIEEHGELNGMQGTVLLTIVDPERILLGKAQEHLAVREIEPGKWMVVVYNESKDDGFIITAFMTRKHRQLERREKIWP